MSEYAESQPNGWELINLGDVISVLTDYTANGSFEALKLNVKYYNEPEYAALVRTTDLEKKDFNPVRFTDKHGYEFQKKTALFGGEIVLANVGSVGKVYKVPYYPMPMTLAPNTYLVKFDNELINSEFVYQFLVSNFYLQGLYRNISSTTLAAINKDNFRRIPFLIPKSKDVQQKIAKILTTIDQLIEKTQALIDKHTVIKQGMMADFFTRGIDPTTGQLRPPVEQAPHLYKETELGWVPKEWDVTRLDIAVTFLDGQRIPLKQEDRADMRGDIPYYGASGIIDYVNDYIFDDDLILLGEDGENVISRNVPLSFQINGKSWVNNHAHVLKPISGNDIEYLTEYLEYQDYSSIISGSAQPKITQGLLAKMKIKLPKLAEQIRIGSHIQTVKQMLDKEEHYLEKLKIQKQGLMQDLLTGKVFV